MKIITLTRGREALIDDEDLERVTKNKWHWNKGHYRNFDNNDQNNGYARREHYPGGNHENGKRKRKTIWLHRFLMDCPPGLVVDHIDGNGLNNQKSNLRVITHSQNMNNRRDNVA